MLEGNITFRTARTILFGNNSLEQISGIIENLEARKVLVITDKGIVGCGLIDRLKVHLGQFQYAVYDGVEETPSLETIRKCTGYAREGQFDLLVGFGGGSPMDAAKAVSVMMTHEDDIADLLGSDTVRVPGVKTILVTTTAGTGSEVTKYSVLAEREGNRNVLTGIADKHLLPEWAVIDPTLTTSMPPSITANTGIDAFSHAVESYLNIRSNFQTEPLALRAIQLLTNNLEKATADGRDLEARHNMSAGSVLAGMSLSQTGGGLAHALAETIQIPYELQHGSAIAVMLPPVMSYNLVENADKYANVALAMGVNPEGLSSAELARESVEKIRHIIHAVGLPRGLSELNIPEKDLAEIAKSVPLFAPGLLKVNPRSAEEKDLLDILREAY